MLIGGLIVGPWGVYRLLMKRWRWLTGERAFTLFILLLGAGALVVAAHDPALRPQVVGLHATPSWVAAYALSVLIGGIGCYGLGRGGLGAPVSRATTLPGRRVMQWMGVAVVMGLVEEYYFRGVWGTLGGALLANLLYVLLLSPRRLHAWELLNALTLFGFGLSLSWAYVVTHSLAIPAGLHTAAYFVYHRWPRILAGRSPRTWGYWMGGEDPALGIGPVAVYWVAAWLSVRVVAGWS